MTAILILDIIICMTPNKCVGNNMFDHAFFNKFIFNYATVLW